MIFLLIAAGILFSSGCKKEEATEPITNPPVPPAQSLTLSGSVVDASSQSAIAGATVKIAKLDKTVLTTLTSGTDGTYSYDASSVTDSVLNLSATKDGYAFGSATAKISKKTNSASVPTIGLAKLVVATAPVTPVAGGTASAVSPDATKPLTVAVPPNAVAQNITLTAAVVPVSQTPPVSATSGTLAGGQFGPSGTVFQQPVTITFPLPSVSDPGTTFPLMQLNEQTNEYTNSGFTATVRSDSLTASAPVTHFTTYVISEVITLTVNLGATTTAATTTTDGRAYIELSQGRANANYSFISTYQRTTAGSGGHPEGAIRAYLKSQADINTLSTTQVNQSYNFPALPTNYQSNGVQINPNVPGKGSWTYRWYKLISSTAYTGNITCNHRPSPVGFTGSKNQLVDDNSKTGWYWRSHDQGGAVTGPY
jgi:hypothetical protein